MNKLISGVFISATRRLTFTIPTDISIPLGTFIRFQITRVGQKEFNMGFRVLSNAQPAIIYAELYQGATLKERGAVGTLFFPPYQYSAIIRTILTTAANTFNAWEFVFNINMDVKNIYLKFPTILEGSTFFANNLGGFSEFDRVPCASSHFLNGAGECISIWEILH